jgi:hypothetical protein
MHRGQRNPAAGRILTRRERRFRPPAPSFRANARSPGSYAGSVLISQSKASNREGRKGFAKVAKKSKIEFGRYPCASVIADARKHQGSSLRWG